jgi:hypothetical protein
MKRLMGALLCAIIVLALTACQPTPENSAVVGKGDLEAKITDAPVVLSGVPESFKDSYSEGRVNVNIDAVVDTSDVSKIPVVKVTPDRFTQDKVDKIIAALMQGQTIYEADTQDSRQEMEDELVYLQSLLEENEGEGADRINEQIMELRKAIVNAPETVDRIPSDGKLKTVVAQEEAISGFTGQSLHVMANLGQTYDAELLIHSSESGKTAGARFTNQDEYSGYSKYDTTAAGTATGMEMTLQDAQALAEKTVQDMGAGLDLAAVRIGTMHSEILGSAEPRQAYVFWFTRSVNGMPSTYELNDGSMTNVPEGGDAYYFEPYPYERLYVVVDDTGVVELNWTSPVSVTGMVSENVGIRGFDEMMETFKEQFFIQNAMKSTGNAIPDVALPGPDGASIASPQIVQYNYTVDRITLGLMRLPVRDNANEYMLVPVWDFFGTRQEIYAEPYTDVDGNTATSATYDCSVNSFLTINAIDGSIINRLTGGIG